jgi:hypothetical protein
MKRKRNKKHGKSKKAKNCSEEKIILVVLPGASGKLSTDFITHLIPALEHTGLFEIRERCEKWKGWNPISNGESVVSSLCPSSNVNAWFILGCSFGNRVASSIVSDELFGTTSAPGLILTGYPMYGTKGDEQRVEHIQKLPTAARVLAISGAKDEFITKNVPKGRPQVQWGLALVL